MKSIAYLSLALFSISLVGCMDSDEIKMVGLPTIVWVKQDRGLVHQSETLLRFGSALYS
jgi:hypothetical protein